MHQNNGWMNDWSGGGMWTWGVVGVIAVLVVVLLVVAIVKMSNKKS